MIMAICSLFSVGDSIPSVKKETEKVIREKFKLLPRFEGIIPPDVRGSRDYQLLADIQLENALINKPSDALFVVAITPYDLYSNGLNFVFGIAYPFRGCIVSYARLYSDNEELFLSRVRKEVTHEMGHVFGLSHCPNPKCVMHFSNSLYDTDYKEEEFCSNCKKKLYLSMKNLGLI
ncbi:Peptidase zinc-dependent [Methanocaldococcus lauensis]|nr:Peptidase zinc-dependent [Methanocaldococcus lauensis]